MSAGMEIRGSSSGLERPRRKGPGDRFNLALLVALVLLAPLFRSGKTPLALAVIAALAIVGLAWVMLRGRPLNLGKAIWGLLAALLALPLLQWLPIPGLSRDLLPGQSDYFTALTLAGVREGATALSVVPRDTLLGGLTLLLPVGVFLMVQTLSPSQLRRVLRVVFAMVIFQAVFGLMQFGGGPDSPLYLGMEYTHWGSAVGTYTSRNNYVGFLYLCLMVCLALFMTTLGRRHRTMVSRHGGLRARLEYWATSDGHLAFFYGALTLLLILGIVFSRSRAGIGLTMIGIVLVTALLARRIGGGDAFGVVGRIVAIGLALAVAIGLGPVLDRFSAEDPVEDGRWTIFAGVLEAIRDFFPLGSGVGTLENTYPQYRDISRAMLTLNNAHNSYLEWAYTGGLWAMLLIAGFLLLYVLRWRAVWKPGAWGEFRYIQVGAGVGLLLMGLHELVDYNLFVPANMVYFAFFAGIFFYAYQEPRSPMRESPREQLPSKALRPPTPNREPARPALPNRDTGSAAGTPPTWNPFMDVEDAEDAEVDDESRRDEAGTTREPSVSTNTATRAADDPWGEPAGDQEDSRDGPKPPVQRKNPFDS